jgi:hypothetical protein
LTHFVIQIVALQRFMAFRSHWRFAAEFCTPGEGMRRVALKGKAVISGATI